MNKKHIEKENNETLLNAIVEKDKEIKELKLKLSRFPFILDEGKKLISIIFTFFRSIFEHIYNM